MLILGVIAAMLAACMSPYHSMKDPGQNYIRSTYASPAAYYDDGWYPWWSMNYYYPGSHFYRPGYGGSFYFSLFSGYPYYDPWFFPAYYSGWYAPYRFYDPWYGGYYGRGFGFRGYDPYWRYGYRVHDHRTPRDDLSGGDHAGGNNSDGRSPAFGKYREDDRFGRFDQGVLKLPQTAENASDVSSGGRVDRGKTNFKSGAGMVGPSHTEPVSGNKAERSSSPAPAVQTGPGRMYSPSTRSIPENVARPVRPYSAPTSPRASKSGGERDHR